MEEVTAYRAFGIFGDYDGNAPDTHTICHVASEEVAEQLCAMLNEDPQAYVVVYVEGYEYAKSFRCRPELVERKDGVHNTLQDALDEFSEYLSEDEDEDEDDEDEDEGDEDEDDE